MPVRVAGDSENWCTLRALRAKRFGVRRFAKLRLCGSKVETHIIGSLLSEPVQAVSQAAKLWRRRSFELLHAGATFGACVAL